MNNKSKPIKCNICGEIVGYNETGEIPQPAMFCKNRPHKLKKKKFINQKALK